MIWAPRERHADCLNPCRERPLKQPDVARVAYAPESLSDVFERLACIVRQDARGHALGLTSLEDPGYRFLESRVRELTRNPHRQREIKMPHPDQVDARNGEDSVDILHAPSRFNQEAAQHAVVGCSRFVRHVSGEKVVVSDREGCAAASRGVVAAGFDYLGGVTRRLHPGNDHPSRSHSEHPADSPIMRKHSSVQQSEWGVKITLSNPSRGSPSGTGSTSSTSSAAPRIRRSLRARYRAA